ncbi:MAG: hypothetical protein HeimC3_45540 [Candidatus Heimdallarchaeota archaeon LC_3]|nr:MAG: hypothetical protein HeimC3_45540 [Candidatus Heimdallarchaeota archaeon LC_3]
MSRVVKRPLVNEEITNKTRVRRKRKVGSLLNSITINDGVNL